MTLPTVILRPRDLKAATGLSISTVYRMIKRGEFPQPKRLGLQAVGWTAAMIAAWLDARPTHFDTLGAGSQA